jgi:FdhD protein
VLLTTGRITSEILIKTRRMGIPILISRSGATSLAVSLGLQFGVTLIGYVRAKKMTIYTGRERIR